MQECLCEWCSCVCIDGVSLQDVQYSKLNWQVGAWRIWSLMVWSQYGGHPSVCQPKPKPWLHVFVCAMTCPFFLSFLFFFFLFCLSLCVCLCLPLWLTDANTPKKCRALFGLDQLSLWCKPCRYNCCSANGRKTSTMSSFFLLDYDYYYIPLKKHSFHPCGNGWQTLLLAPSLLPRSFLL